jgi:hypothetical protein
MRMQPTQLRGTNAAGSSSKYAKKHPAGAHGKSLAAHPVVGIFYHLSLSHERLCSSLAARCATVSGNRRSSLGSAADSTSSSSQAQVLFVHRNSSGQ